MGLLVLGPRVQLHLNVVEHMEGNSCKLVAPGLRRFCHRRTARDFQRPPRVQDTAPLEGQK